MKYHENVNLLIISIAEGDSVAFSKFFDIFYDKIYRLSRYFSHSEETCKDVVSDVFYNLWNNRKKLKLVNNIEAYLYSSVKNQALKYIYRNQRFNLDPLEAITGDFYIETQSPDSIMMGKELGIIIEKAVNELPPKCKTVFLLVREEGLRYKEVAELLSISERTVQGQMIIATKKIISTIQKHYPNLPADKALILFTLFFKKNKLML
jgi:RNA polymerase sigma-70 factor (ECF subfamily)